MIIPTVWEFTKDGARGSDIFSKLLEKRIIMVTGVVDEQMATLVTSQLLYLESVDAEKDIWMYINSPGGSCIDGLQIIDTMNFIKPKVGTLVTGLAASMGFALLSSGEKGMRYALPNAQIMAHRVSSGTRGHIEDMRISFQHSEHVDKVLTRIITKNIGMSEKKYLDHVLRDKWFTSEEALQFGTHGIIDKIVDKRV